MDSPERRILLSRYLAHYGARVTHYADGPAVAEISMPLAAGHVRDDRPLSQDPGSAFISMVRFDPDRIVLVGALDGEGRLECTSDAVMDVIKRNSAATVQRSFRRFLRLGEPYLTMPPLWW